MNETRDDEVFSLSIESTLYKYRVDKHGDIYAFLPRQEYDLRLEYFIVVCCDIN